MNMKGKPFENMNTSAKNRYCRTVCEFIAVSAMFALIALGFGCLPERVSDIYTVSAGTDECARVVVIDAGHGGEDGGAVSRAFRAGAPQFSHAPDGRVPYSSAYTNPSRSRMVFRFCLPR